MPKCCKWKVKDGKPPRDFGNMTMEEDAQALSWQGRGMCDIIENLRDPAIDPEPELAPSPPVDNVEAANEPVDPTFAVETHAAVIDEPVEAAVLRRSGRPSKRRGRN